MGSQCKKDLIRDTYRPRLGRAFPVPFNYQGNFPEADDVGVWADITIFIKQWLNVWALKSGRPGDKLRPGLDSTPASSLLASCVN